ncbi:MAG: AHH domain-containing protein [Gemmataceae bacterium]|nr:AHH domain-containing protein [Gemmataceae bacterium]
MGLKPKAAEDGLDAHHIVQSTNNKIPEFQKARDLLLEHQIDINSAANGVALRTTKPNAPAPADPNLRMHKGGELHTNEGGRRTYERLKKAMEQAGSDWGARRQALLRELERMRTQIAAGTFP